MNQIVIAKTICYNNHQNDVRAQHMDSNMNCFFGDDYNICRTCGEKNVPGAAAFRIEEMSMAVSA